LVAFFLARRINKSEMNCVLAPSEAQNVLPGRYRIVATLRIPNKFNLSGETIVNVAEEPVENVVVLVTPSQRITGRLEIEDSSPEVRQAVEAGQLHVNLRPNPSLAFLSGSAAAAKDGAFVLNDVGVVHYRVELFGLPADAYIASARSRRSNTCNVSTVTAWPGRASPSNTSTRPACLGCCHRNTGHDCQAGACEAVRACCCRIASGQASRQGTRSEAHHRGPGQDPHHARLRSVCAGHSGFPKKYS